MAGKTTFLNDTEKLEYYAQISGCDLQKYFHAFDVRIYEGAEILLYHYDQRGRLEIDTIMLCTDITVNERGIRITVVDKRDFKVVKIGEIPNKFNGLPIVTHAPYFMRVERTVKRTENGKMIKGLSSIMCFRSQSLPGKKIAGHIQAVPYITAHHKLTDLEGALQRLEEEG